MSAGAADPAWIVPQWPAPAGVRALMSTRAGGISQGLFASMNLGDHVSDEPQAVRSNRERLAAAIGARPIFLQQVHGTHVLALAPGLEDGCRADGAVTMRSGLACVVMVADCLPILLARRSRPQVAALHAGWRGLAGQGGVGIVEAGIEKMRHEAGHFDASDLLAWLGPCIGPQAFEVGAEVREAFVAGQPEAQGCFRPGRPGKLMADLATLARLRLARAGVHQLHGNDSSAAWCTVSGSGFFSHRRTSGRPGALPGDTGGRMAACIWLA